MSPTICRRSSPGAACHWSPLHTYTPLAFDFTPPATPGRLERRSLYTTFTQIFATMFVAPKMFSGSRQAPPRFSERLSRCQDACFAPILPRRAAIRSAYDTLFCCCRRLLMTSEMIFADAYAAIGFTALFFRLCLMLPPPSQNE